MVTLISWQSSGGDAGRCDAKCYGAELPVCDCICGGRNHGAGLEKALDQTRELADGWVAEARAGGQVIPWYEVPADVRTEPLFRLDDVPGKRDA